MSEYTHTHMNRKAVSVQTKQNYFQPSLHTITTHIPQVCISKKAMIITSRTNLLTSQNLQNIRSFI